MCVFVGGMGAGGDNRNRDTERDRNRETDGSFGMEDSTVNYSPHTDELSVFASAFLTKVKSSPDLWVANIDIPMTV